MLWNEIRSNVPLLEVRLIQQFVQEVYVRLYPSIATSPRALIIFRIALWRSLS